MADAVWCFIVSFCPQGKAGIDRPLIARLHPVCQQKSRPWCGAGSPSRQPQRWSFFIRKAPTLVSQWGASHVGTQPTRHAATSWLTAAPFLVAGVRAAAVDQIAEMPAGLFTAFLPQLVQALKYEMYHDRCACEGREHASAGTLRGLPRPRSRRISAGLG